MHRSPEWRCRSQSPADQVPVSSASTQTRDRALNPPRLHPSFGPLGLRGLCPVLIRRLRAWGRESGGRHLHLGLEEGPPRSPALVVTSVGVGGQGTALSVFPLHSGNHLFLSFQGFRMDWLDLLAVQGTLKRSEERRVGKECRSRWSPYH